MRSFNWKLLLPNGLTLARLLLIIPFVQFVLQGDHFWAGTMALLAIITDLDGTVARAIGATSKFGALFDPIVDATFEVVGYVVLIYTHNLLLWPAALFVACTIYKAFPQTTYLRKHGKVKSLIISKTMGMIGFGSVIIAAYGAPLWLSATTLVIGAIGYFILGTRWLLNDGLHY